MTKSKKAPAASNAGTLAPVVQVLHDLYAEAAERVLRHDGTVLPEVVITIQRDSRKWGHITLWNAWQSDSAGRLEVMVSGENLARGPVAVLGTLLHEAAHGYNYVRGIRDCDAQGRHNLRFKKAAEQVFGLVITKNQHVWSETTVPADTVEAWKDGLRRLEEVLKVAALAAPAKAPKRRNTNLAVFECDECGAKLRASESTFSVGISHGCGGEFVPVASAAGTAGDFEVVRPDLLKKMVRGAV